MIFYKTYPPSNFQKSIIREFQILHMKWDNITPMPPPYIECLGNTEQNLYFYPRYGVKLFGDGFQDIPVPKVIITGPKSKPVGLKFGNDFLMIKIAFHPTGLFRLLKIKMNQTVNQGLDAINFFGTEVYCVNEQLSELDNYDELFSIVSHFIDKELAKGFNQEEPIDQVAIQMLNPTIQNSLNDWSSKACLSLRQFERSFITRVGLTPKLFVRIVRFEHAMRIKNRFPDKSWSEIALEANYTDSRHLLKEFRDFAMFTPGSLLQLQTSGYSDFPTG